MKNVIAALHCWRSRFTGFILSDILHTKLLCVLQENLPNIKNWKESVIYIWPIHVILFLSLSVNTVKRRYPSS